MSDIVEFRHREYLVAMLSVVISACPKLTTCDQSSDQMVEAYIGYPLLVREGRNEFIQYLPGSLLAWARFVLPQKKETFRIAKAIIRPPIGAHF